jgi:hypothetical protein
LLPFPPAGSGSYEIRHRGSELDPIPSPPADNTHHSPHPSFRHRCRTTSPRNATPQTAPHTSCRLHVPRSTSPCTTLPLEKKKAQTSRHTLASLSWQGGRHSSSGAYIRLRGVATPPSSLISQSRPSLHLEIHTQLRIPPSHTCRQTRRGHSRTPRAGPRRHRLAVARGDRAEPSAPATRGSPPINKYVHRSAPTHTSFSASAKTSRLG